MAENAALRAIRLLDLVPYLTANPGISVKELANVFQTTSNEIVKDLDLLFVCGLPGYTPLELIDLSVDDGYVTIRDPQNLAAPRKFSEEEALTLRIALSALEEFLPRERREPVRLLREKIAALFSREIPDSALFYQTDASKERLRLINEALGKRKRLGFIYKNLLTGETSKRELSIAHVLMERSRTLVEGWDHSVKGKRTFQLAQMEELQILNEPSEVFDDLPNQSVNEVELTGPPESHFFLENQALLTRISSDRMKLELFQPEWLIRNVLAEAGLIAVQQPASIRQRVRLIAQSALSNY